MIAIFRLIAATLYTGWVTALIVYLLFAPTPKCTPDPPLAEYLFAIPASLVFGYLLVDSAVRIWRWALRSKPAPPMVMRRRYGRSGTAPTSWA